MCGCECCIYAKSIHSPSIYSRDRYLKKLKYQSQNAQSRRSGEKSHHIYKHIKIQSCHMDVIFIQKQLIWHKLQCAHILSLIMHFHTINVYCGAVKNVHVSIFLTNTQIISVQKRHPQLGFTFITSLDLVLLMVEFH